MKSLDRSSKLVLLTHLACLVVFGLAGAFLGGTHHYVLGINLGSFIGTMVPGLYGILAVRQKQAGATEIARLCAGVFDNGYIKDKATRPHIETIRGVTYATWFGLAASVAFCGLLLHWSFLGCLGAAGIGLVLGVLVTLAFEG